MFLPDVTNIRSPMTFAPVVRPTSCLIDPSYSTLSDITASGNWAAAGAAAASVSTTAVRNVRSDGIRAPNVHGRQNLRPTVVWLSSSRAMIRAGSAGPPPMNLVLRQHPFAAYCQKVLIALYELELPFTSHQVDGVEGREALAALWPM